MIPSLKSIDGIECHSDAEAYDGDENLPSSNKVRKIIGRHQQTNKIVDLNDIAIEQFSENMKNEIEAWNVYIECLLA